VAEEQIHEGARRRMVGLHFGGERVARGFGGSIGEQAVCVNYGHAVQVIGMAALAIQAQGGAVTFGRDEQGEAVVPQHALDRVLPLLIRRLQSHAQEDDLLGLKAQLGDEQTAQARGLRGLRLVTGLALARAELADFGLHLRSLCAEGAGLLVEERLLTGVVIAEGLEGGE